MEFSQRQKKYPLQDNELPSFQYITPQSCSNESSAAPPNRSDVDWQLRLHISRHRNTTGGSDRTDLTSHAAMRAVQHLLSVAM
ncbi:hypothetical protein J6590_038124 [Homalodisca vitripennis]|nr:hypothetical protein J6590_038124 [Homalodisca vitripennis]